MGPCVLKQWAKSKRPLGLSKQSHPRHQPLYKGHRPCSQALAAASMASLKSDEDPTAGSASCSCQAANNNTVHTRAPRRRQLFSWGPCLQRIILAAVALMGSPLILILDIAERAELAVHQLQQLWGNMTSAQQVSSQFSLRLAAAAAVDGSLAQDQVLQQERVSKEIVAGFNNWDRSASRSSGGNDSGSTSSKYDNSNSSSSSNEGQSWGDRWQPQFNRWPPLVFMALTVLPAAAIAVKHCHVNAVLQPVIWASGSLLGQSVVNPLVVVVQRYSSRKHRVVAAASWAPATCGQQHQTSQVAAAGCVTSHSGDRRTAHLSNDTGSCKPARKHGISRADRAMAACFWVMQVAGDAFRLWCVYRVAVLVWQQHTASLPAIWALSSASMLQNAASAGIGQLLGVMSALVVTMCQHLAIWLVPMFDVCLCIAGASVYALAIIGRVLPVCNPITFRQCSVVFMPGWLHCIGGMGRQRQQQQQVQQRCVCAD